MMNDSDSPLAILPINEMSQVLDVQNRFELACQASSDATPAIESYFAEIAGKGQKLEQVMLHHLIILDLQYRSERHESLEIQSYLERFPSHAYVVQSCFRAFEQLTRSLDIIGPLAEGGLGAVDIAWDRSLNRKVAFKRLKTDFADDREKQARFRREAVITARLKHPCIVTIYSLEQDSAGRISYVMPLIDGEPLDVVIQRFHAELSNDRSSAKYARKLLTLLRHFIDACQAVAYAHSQGCIHRDLKPQNIMVGRFGETVVVDWGLAKFLAEDLDPNDQSLGQQSITRDFDDEKSPVTHTGDILGTPMYMSPEQAKGNCASTRSDIYSLGVTFYYLLTGALPFKEPDSKSLLAEVIVGNFPSPRSIQPQTPRALEAICLKCMALQPKDRYASVEQLIRDIDSWLANEAVSAFSEPWHFRFARIVRRYPTLSAVGVATSLLIVIGLIAATALTRVQNQQLSKAVSAAELESQRADQMFQFFVEELSAASPDKLGSERVADINQLMEHMIQSSNRFRQSSPATYAKLLWNISNICKDRSEVRSAQVGYESLLSFLGDGSLTVFSGAKDLINPVKLKLAECYLTQPELVSRIEPLLSDLRLKDLDDEYRVVYAAAMGWCKVYQLDYPAAQAFVDQYQRGTSASLDRLQATIWTSTQKEREACELLKELIQNLPEEKEKDAILLNNSLANVYRHLNQFDDAEACTLRSIQLADKYFDGHDQSRLMPRGCSWRSTMAVDDLKMLSTCRDKLRKY